MKTYETGIQKDKTIFGEIKFDSKRIGVWKNGNKWVKREKSPANIQYKITPQDEIELNKSVLSIPDCGSNSCRYSRYKGGMRTNSRCRCPK